MDMVEKVARAMAENAGFAWEYCAQSQWKSDARAGIEAMREPTEEMLAGANAKLEESDRAGFTISEWYSAMIDAALLGE
jgi:hypothetical protein